MMTGRDVARLLGSVAAIVGLWTAFAFFRASEVYRVAIDTGFTPNQSWPLMLAFQFTSGMLWSVLTPVIIFIAERLPLRKPFRWRNALLILLAIPLLAIFRAAFGGAVLCLSEGATSAAEVGAFVLLSIRVRFYRNVFLVAVVIGIVNLVLANRAAAESERNALRVKKELANDQLQRLRAVMQPRFLFAALHAVKSEVSRQPLVADKMLVDLGNVLRKMLEFEKCEDVSLAEELAVVERCLELERTRTGGLFTTRVEIDRQLRDARIPPLLLHAVAESAVLIDGTGAGHLELEAWSEEGALKILIRNDDPRRSPGATALEATRARLQRAYGDRGSVESRPWEGGVVTTLTLPLITGEAPTSGWPRSRH